MLNAKDTEIMRQVALMARDRSAPRAPHLAGVAGLVASAVLEDGRIVMALRGQAPIIITADACHDVIAVLGAAHAEAKSVMLVLAEKAKKATAAG
jgi:hypothetical protein